MELLMVQIFIYRVYLESLCKDESEMLCCTCNEKTNRFIFLHDHQNDQNHRVSGVHARSSEVVNTHRESIT